MIIPMRHPRMGVAQPGQAGRSRGSAVSERDPVAQRLAALTSAVSAALRAFVLLLALLALVWRVAPTANTGALYLALALGSLMLGTGCLRPLPFWLALAADATVIALVLQGSGAGSSPFLGLTLLLSVHGAFQGGKRDVVIRSGGGLVTLLLLGLLDPALADNLLAALIVAHLAVGAATIWVCEQLRAVSNESRARLARDDRNRQAGDRALRAIEWQRLNLCIAECDTLEALAWQASERASAIAGAAVEVELKGVGGLRPPAAGEGGWVKSNVEALRLPIGPGDALIVYRAPAELDDAQLAALNHLAALVKLRVEALRSAAQLLRQQAGALALWQLAGVLRVAPDLHVALHEACARLASALDLDWLALLAPDDRRALAPLLFARGHTGAAASHLTGAQVRVAAEALRSELPLVRDEGHAALVCLPVHTPTHSSAVLAAHGPADPATQALLMLLGDMLGQRGSYSIMCKGDEPQSRALSAVEGAAKGAKGWGG